MTRFSTGIGAVLAVAIAAVPHQASAAISSKMAFTARVADAGTPVTGTHTFVFRLFDAASGGSQLWQESQPGLAVNAGVVNATLGAITPIPAGVFNGAPLFLEVTYDATTLSPRLDVLTVAYAMRADTADNALQCVNATNAVNATTAANAVNATTASTATNANHATTADSATTAGSATTASTATTAGSVPWTGVTGVPFTSSGGDNGSASSIARGDHLHDGRYYTKANLQTSGQAQVHWGNITSRPTLTCSAVPHAEDVASGAMLIVESCCPAGAVLTGGGVLVHGYPTWTILGTYPWGNCWRSMARNDNVGTQSLETFAQCCQL